MPDGFSVQSFGGGNRGGHLLVFRIGVDYPWENAIRVYKIVYTKVKNSVNEVREEGRHE